MGIKIFRAVNRIAWILWICPDCDTEFLATQISLSSVCELDYRDFLNPFQ